MTRLDINLEGDGAFAEFKDRIKHKGVIVGVATLDAGMTSGLPSIAFAIQLENGEMVFAETSVKMFLLAAAVVGGKYGWP